MKKPPLLDLAKKISSPLTAVSSYQRVAILMAIGTGEACVCHLESALGWRQSYLSQHLMALRKAGILEDRREGRYVYYRLKSNTYLELISTAAELSGFSKELLLKQVNRQVYPSCECPQCAPALIPSSSL